MDRLTGPQFEQLQAALLAAFDRADLTRMVRIELDESLDAIAGGESSSTTLSAAVFNLIEWSERRGRRLTLTNAFERGVRAVRARISALTRGPSRFLPADSSASLHSKES